MWLILDAARTKQEKRGGRKLQSVPQAGRIRRIPECGNDDWLTQLLRKEKPVRSARFRNCAHIASLHPLAVSGR